MWEDFIRSHSVPLGYNNALLSQFESERASERERERERREQDILYESVVRVSNIHFGAIYLITV